MTGDFYEDDEPADKIRSDFEAGAKGETGIRRPPHRLWRSVKTYAWCDCPIGEDHNENAWRCRP